MDKRKTNQAYLLTGGNLGDRLARLTDAREAIETSCGPVRRASPVYETAAWGRTDQPAFLNQVLFIETRLEANPLMKKLLEIEKKMGRVRQEKNGPRLIDIDLLFFNDAVLRTPLLEIPHPRLQDRRFVLVPLASIAPGLVHPVLRKTITELLEACTDPLAVQPYV